MANPFQKGICAVLSLALLAGLPAFPSYAVDNTFRCGTRFYSTIHLSIPDGARIQFQTPPLKKGQKLCYTAGNGQVLHTFVAGKPTQNSDGTIIYNLGYVCCQAGETGAYINLNGKLFMLYSVQVVDDKSKEGFPLNTSFGQIFANQKVEKIVIAHGLSLPKRQTTNAAQINRFLNSLSREKLYRDCNPVKRVGWNFSVDFYLKGQKGYYDYTYTYGFCKVGGFSAPLPIGSSVEANCDKVYQILGDFYNSLN